jgi:hypothetical protein
MAKKAEPPQPVEWEIFKVVAKQTRLGDDEAVGADEAIEKGAEQFNQPAMKLTAVRQR